MATSQTDTYLLGRDRFESNRLAEQHELSVKTLGYAIHPAIQARLPPKARIADVATGTGVWAIHAAQLFSDGTQVIGFDISAAQFPSSSHPNVTFTVADAKKSFPEADQGTFDLVHIRALIAAMQPAEWDIVMRNIVQLLKPGGSVQWGEGDLGHVRTLRSNSDGHHFTAMPEILRKWEAAMGERLSATVRKLPEAAFAHLENVQLDVVSTDRLPEMRAPWTRQLMNAHLAFVGKIDHWSSQKMEESRTLLAAEIENGAYIRADLIIVIGQKPL